MASGKPQSQRAFNSATNECFNLFAIVGDCSYPECFECEAQFRSFPAQTLENLSYTSGLSIAEARTIISGYVNSIKGDLTYLCEKLDCHGNAIINRWKKKTPLKREEILRAAFPDLYEKKWFLIHAYYDYPSWKETRPLRAGFLLPYLSIETFREDPYKLYALLHARTKFNPEDWVAFDKHQTNMG